METIVKQLLREINSLKRRIEHLERLEPEAVHTADFQIRNAAPALSFKETDQTLPAGLWRLILTENIFTLQRNTAVAGDFSTVTTPLTVDGDDDTALTGDFVVNGTDLVVVESTGYVGVQKTPGVPLDVSGKIRTDNQVESTVTTGTAPLVVASTTKVANLNVDSLDDLDESAFALLAGRSGGQTLYGGTASGNDLVLESTSHATKGVTQVNGILTISD